MSDFYLVERKPSEYDEGLREFEELIDSLEAE